MNSFQSQVLQPHKTSEPVSAYELLLSHEQFRQLQALIPCGLSLVSMTKNPRNIPKRAPSTVQLPETEATFSEKRPAFKHAQNKISNSSDYLARCQELLLQLKKHPRIQPFLVPVDPIALGIPDYPTIITEPMDISTIEQKLNSREYKAFEEFDADVRKMIKNALTYNKPGTVVNKMAEELSGFYERILNDKNGAALNLVKKNSKISKSSENDKTKIKTKSTAPVAHPLNYSEKQRLSELIQKKLPNEYLWDVWRIVAPGHNAAEEDLDFDIDQLSPEVARELQRFVDSKINPSQKKKKKSPEELVKPQVKTEVNTVVTTPVAPVQQTAPPKQPVVKPISNQDSDFGSDILNSDSDESNI